jgi:hypothetical protein
VPDRILNFFFEAPAKATTKRARVGGGSLVGSSACLKNAAARLQDLA